MGESGKNPKVEKVLQGSQVFLFPCACPANMAGHARDGVFIYPHRAMPWPLFSKWVHPILHRWMVQRARELSYDPSGSRRGSDPTSVTVDDVSSMLDHSGCHMLVLVSVSEG
jgi:hypothetical protein